MRRHSPFLVAAVTLGTMVLSIGGAGSAAAVAPDGWSDFNGDGYSDLAVGLQNATVTGLETAGAVIVLYGGPTGLTGTGSQHWNANNSLDTADDAQEMARFGYSLAAGDFDRDGFGDLAIGAPFWGVDGPDTAQWSGKVYVLFGSAAGLTSARTKTWRPTGPGTRVANAGYALAALDWFDFAGTSDAGDGYADLAVGAPGSGPNGQVSGRVTVISGQYLAGMPNAFTTSWYGTGTNSRFGHALAAGDFNDTIAGPKVGLDDLAIGVPFHHGNGGTIPFSGKVVVKQRDANGVLQTRHFDQDTGTIAGVSEEHDQFGSVLAAGDVVGSGLDDLVVGVPNEDLTLAGDTAEWAGVVHVISSGPRGSGLLSTSTLYRQGLAGIPGTPNTPDQFGASLAIADFGHDTGLDLAIGSPREVAGRTPDAGGVFVIYGEEDEGLDPGRPRSGPRRPPASWTRRRSATSSAPSWGPATSTGPDGTTWPSACRGRASCRQVAVPRSMPRGWCTSSTDCRLA